MPELKAFVKLKYHINVAVYFNNVIEIQTLGNHVFKQKFMNGAVFESTIHEIIFKIFLPIRIMVSNVTCYRANILLIKEK